MPDKIQHGKAFDGLMKHYFKKDMWKWLQRDKSKAEKKHKCPCCGYYTIADDQGFLFLVTSAQFAFGKWTHCLNPMSRRMQIMD